MKKLIITLSFLFLSLFIYAQNVGIVLFKNGFSSPVDIQNAGDDRLFIVEQSGRIKILNAEYSSTNEFLYKWHGTNQNGDKVNSGIYIIMCSVGDTRTARKVVYLKQI